MVSINGLGTDISSNWNFKDGDLVLVSDEDNIIQSIANRLKTLNGYLNLFYINYGSNLITFSGWKLNDETLSFIKLEVENVLDQDPRLKDNTEVNVYYNDENKPVIEIRAFYNNDSDLSLSLIISEDGSVNIAS